MFSGVFEAHGYAGSHKSIFTCSSDGSLLGISLSSSSTCRVGSSRLPQSMRVKDPHAAPVIGSGPGRCSSAMLDADNADHPCAFREQVDVEQERARDALHSRGLEAHDVLEASILRESLGVRTDGLGGRVTVTAARDYRLDHALICLQLQASFDGGRVRGQSARCFIEAC